MGAADPGQLNRFGEHPAATLEFGEPVDGWVSWSTQDGLEIANITIAGDHRACSSRWLSVEPGLDAAYDLRHRGNVTALRITFPAVHQDLGSVLVMRSMLGDNISQRILGDLYDPGKTSRLRPVPVTAHYLERRAVRRAWRQQWRRLRKAALSEHLRLILPQNTP